MYNPYTLSRQGNRKINSRRREERRGGRKEGGKRRRRREGVMGTEADGG